MLICIFLIVVIVFFIIMFYIGKNWKVKCPKCGSKLEVEDGFYQVVDFKDKLSESAYQKLRSKAVPIHGTRDSKGIDVFYRRCMNCNYVYIQHNTD